MTSEVEELAVPQTAKEISDNQVVVDEIEDDLVNDDIDEESEVIADLARLCGNDKKLELVGSVMLDALCCKDPVSKDDIDAAKLKSIVETGDVSNELKKLDDFFMSGGDIKIINGLPLGICVRVKES